MSVVMIEVVRNRPLSGVEVASHWQPRYNAGKPVKLFAKIQGTKGSSLIFTGNNFRGIQKVWESSDEKRHQITLFNNIMK